MAEPDTRGSLVRRFRELGFNFVTIDLDGLQSGSLNVLVSLEHKKRYSTRDSIPEPL